MDSKNTESRILNHYFNVAKAGWPGLCSCVRGLRGFGGWERNSKGSEDTRL